MVPKVAELLCSGNDSLCKASSQAHSTPGAQGAMPSPYFALPPPTCQSAKEWREGQVEATRSTPLCLSTTQQAGRLGKVGVRPAKRQGEGGCPIDAFPYPPVSQLRGKGWWYL